MDKRQSPRLTKNPNWGAIEIAALYLLIGGLWILLSDRAAEAIALNEEMLVTISLYKGWAYVFITALLLYWLVQRRTAALRASEAQLQQVMDALPVLISYVDADGRYLLTNKTYEEWFGGTARGKTLMEVMSEEMYKKVSKYVDQVLKGETVRYESVFPYPLGERFINATYIPDKTADGQVKGFFALVQDMTERKRAEEENKSLARFPDENPNPVLRATHAGKIIYANAASELLLQDWHCRVGDDLPPDWITWVKELVLSGARKTVDVRCQDTIYSITLAPIPGAGYVNLYGQDITERKQAETAVLESSLQFRTLFEASPDANLLIDPHGSWPILDCNTAACQMNGYTHDELVGQPVDILNSHPLPPEKLGDYLASIRQAGVLHYEAMHRRKDGTEFPIEVSTSLISLSGRDVLLGIDRDITERRRAEDALHASEERYRAVVDHALDAIIVTDPAGTGRVLSANPAACRMFGYSMEEFLGLGREDMLDRNDPKLAALLQKREQYGQATAELTYKRKDATRFLGELSSTFYQDKNGERRSISIIRDITERKLAEETMRRFELLSEHSRDIILFLDRKDGRILEANAAARQAYGYSRAELLGLTIQDLRAGDNYDLTANQLAQADTGGILFETIHRRKDGTTFPVEVNSQGATIGNTRTLVSIVRDITERKHTERALQESQLRLSFALEKSHTGGWDLDLVDHTALRTLEHDRIFGYESLLPEWTYEMFLDHVLLEDRDEVDRLFQEAITTQTDWSFECRIRRTDGEIRWIWAIGGHRFDETGHAYRMAGIVQDITERKQAEAEIHRLNEQLEQRVIERTAQLQAANKELEAFSYSVSHDLRAPLRAIDGYTRILVEDYEATLDAEGKRICGIISAEARRMGQLIDDLLAFSRLGRKEIYSSRVDMKALAASVFDELMKTEDRERIDFQITRLPAVKADPSLIRQVWINLLSNALKFTSKKKRATIKVGSKQSADEYIYYVRDTGAGFDMEYVDKLFGVFQRLHGESEFEGTGVGLAIVQRIVHRHGGRVWAEGEPDKGATFYFALPRQENAHE